MWGVVNNGTTNENSGGAEQGSSTGTEYFGASPATVTDGAPVGIDNSGDGEFMHLYDNGNMAGALSAWDGNFYAGSTGAYNARIGSFGTGNTQIFGGNKLALTLSNNSGTEQIQFFGNSQQITGLQGLNGQKLATCRGSFKSGDLWMTDANGNCVDSGLNPANVMRSLADPRPGKLTCWTARGTIGSCTTRPDQNGSCICK